MTKFIPRSVLRHRMTNFRQIQILSPRFCSSKNDQQNIQSVLENFKKPKKEAKSELNKVLQNFKKPAFAQETDIKKYKYAQIDRGNRTLKKDFEKPFVSKETDFNKYQKVNVNSSRYRHFFDRALVVFSSFDPKMENFDTKIEIDEWFSKAIKAKNDKLFEEILVDLVKLVLNNDKKVLLYIIPMLECLDHLNYGDKLKLVKTMDAVSLEILGMYIMSLLKNLLHYFVKSILSQNSHRQKRPIQFKNINKTIFQIFRYLIKVHKLILSFTCT